MRIRAVTASDADEIAAIYAPIVRDTAISFETEPPTSAEIGSRIAHIAKRFPWLVAEVDGRVAGYAYACPHRDRAAYRWSVDVTVYVHSDFRRRGVGEALYRDLFHQLRQLGYQSAFAGITLPNPASVGLHESLGFRPIGMYERVGFKHGSWHNTGWWGLAIGDFEDSPREPAPHNQDK